MKPFSTKPWRWMAAKDGIPEDGDCFFGSIVEALRHDTEEPHIEVPTSKGLRRLVASELAKNTDAMESYLVSASMDDVPQWMEPLNTFLLTTPDATAQEKYIELVTLVLSEDKRYWADEFALSAVSRALNVMILIVDSHRDVRSVQKRFQGNVPSIGVHTRRPERIVVLKLSGSVRSNSGHYQPLLNTATGRGCWTPETLPPFVSTRFATVLRKSPWFKG